MAIVELEKVSKRYGEVLAVQDFTLDHERWGIRRPRWTFGLREDNDDADDRRSRRDHGGSIRIGGRDVVGMIPRERDVAMVFQNYALFPHMNVFGNMAFGLRLRKLPKQQIKNRFTRRRKSWASRTFCRRPKELSGGQRQRVALGRAIVREPRVFLMDEPLSNIDAKLRVEMRAEIIKLQRRLGVTTFYVTHDQVEALSMGDRVVVMLDGRVQQVGAPKELYNKPTNRFVAGFIGSPAMNFVRARVSAKMALFPPDRIFSYFCQDSQTEKVGRLGLERDHGLEFVRSI